MSDKEKAKLARARAAEYKDRAAECSRLGDFAGAAALLGFAEICEMEAASFEAIEPD